MKSLIATTALVLSMSTAAWAQGYPERPVTIVVPYTAGAVTDVLARHVAHSLQEKWGQPVVVENRPGGGSMLGTAYVAQSDPDGYTLLLTTSAYVTGPAVLTDMPFDPLEGMQPIGLAGYIPMVFVGGPSTEGATLAEFLEEAAAEPLFAATAGLGTTTHFTVEMLMQASGIDMDVVHYGGGGEAVVAVMGGHADIYASTPASSLDNIRNGTLRGLAIAGADRISSLPDVPSTAELGLEGINASFWLGMLAPAGISEELATQINADLNAILDDPALQEQVATIDLVTSTSTVEEFETQVLTELESWATLAQERGITAN
ncbi:Bug family tripartite tricarboxylate transporter substrate binding protein [Pelagibacterium lacus]|nr:tripartite tricarboxylate transporter substrate-binding protein [Pelagibacterium lacus]